MLREIAAILIVCFITLAKYSTEARYSPEQIKQVGQICNATQTDLDVALKYEVPSTSTGKCLMTCILKKVQTLTEEGIYQKEKVLSSFKKYWSEIEDQKLEDLTNECEKAVEGQESLAKSDPCEYGYKVAVCINKLKDIPPESCCTQKRVYVRAKYKPMKGETPDKKSEPTNTVVRRTEMRAKGAVPSQ